MTSKALSRDTRDIKPAGTPATVALNQDGSEWDEVAESSWESFPASDPPAWAGQGSPRPSRAAAFRK